MKTENSEIKESISSKLSTSRKSLRAQLPQVKSRIAVLDAGGQYCHLIARRIRSFGVHTEILPFDTNRSALSEFSGVILSGGPSSVYDTYAPKIGFDPLDLDIPVLGICYGHQVLGLIAGGSVEKSGKKEFGPAILKLAALRSPLFKGIGSGSTVWMSHGDSVASLPADFDIIGSTVDVRIAAVSHKKKPIYGLQFHPEVTHTQSGTKILKNFVFNICGCSKSWSPANLIPSLIREIQVKVGDKNVLFFVSGGVDSAVALWLCSEALRSRTNLIKGIFLDTGFLKTDDYIAARQLTSLLPNVHFEFLDESAEFYQATSELCDPEAKRRAIGETFHRVMLKHIEREQLKKHDWMLGQGTIYPDTIESSGSTNSALIKTHHNRTEVFLNLLERGLLVEPLTEFYKDEVRQIADKLGIPEEISRKHPFPGPGLAIRCLCSSNDSPLYESDELSNILSDSQFDGCIVPIHSVGVKGDYRSYDKLAVIEGRANWRAISSLSREITNSILEVNRIALLLGTAHDRPLGELRIIKKAISHDRIELLRRVDDLVMNFLKSHDIYDSLWQCPVVSIPLSFGYGDSIVIRPVQSTDGMTANFAEIDSSLLSKLTKQVLSFTGVDAILMDVTNKPPATIEWE
ncbi:MAG: glutamine-hydrolyzing GMP synthase [bacterium]|jgi:GMP synthase (glutamine-hydrolysing)